MANYATLKAAIQAVIKQNGNNEITGSLLQQSLLSLITSLGSGYQFLGIATPATNPGTPDQNVFYLASTVGTYTNFGGLVINDGEVCSLVYNGTWAKQITGAATAEKLAFVENVISGIYNVIDGNTITPNGYFINRSTGKWAADSTGIKGCVMAFPYAGKELTIVANATQYGYLAFLKTNNASTGVVPDYCAGTSIETILPATTPVFIVPSDCNYLYVQTLGDTVSRLPQKLIINRNENPTLTKINNRLNLVCEDFVNNQIIADATGSPVAFTNGYRTKAIPLYGIKRIHNFSNGAGGVFFYNSELISADTFIIANTTGYVPEGAVACAVYKTITGGIAPESISYEIEFYDDRQINHEIDEINEAIAEIDERIDELSPLTAVISLNDFEQGSVESGSNPGYPPGSLFVASNRISSRANIVKPLKTIIFTITEGYRAYFLSWDGESALITDYASWQTGVFEFTPQNKYLYVTVGKVDNTDLLPSIGNTAITASSPGRVDIIEENLQILNDTVEEQQEKIDRIFGAQIDCWGDSLTQSSTGYYTDKLAELTGMVVNNYGDGGESALQIAGRHGGCPAVLKSDVVIPASGGVVVDLQSSFNDWDFANGSYFLRSRNSGINPCCIGGIVGNLEYSADGTIFTRATAGTATTIKAGEIVYPRWGANVTDHIQVIWIGQNVDGSFSTNEELVEIIEKMIQYYNNKKFIAVCFIQRGAGPQYVIDAEKIFKKAFGLKSFCPREYLNRYGIDKAIEKGYIQSATAQDIEDIANGLIPTSLRSDAVHLNRYGYWLVAERVYELMLQNDYFNQ